MMIVLGAEDWTLGLMHVKYMVYIPGVRHHNPIVIV